MLWGKRLELVVELLAHRPAKVAWLSDPEAVSAKSNLAALMQSAERMGIKVGRLEVREPSDFDRVFEATAGSEAVLVQWLGSTMAERWQIGDLAARHPLPDMYELTERICVAPRATCVGDMTWPFEYLRARAQASRQIQPRWPTSAPRSISAI